MSQSLYDEVRKSENLFAAWRHVKRSALNSKNGKIRGQASEFEHQHQRHLKTIQTQLQQRRFKFDGVEGVLKDKKLRKTQGKDPRPIVIGSIRNRIVQRAILQTLQPRHVADPANPYSKFVPEMDERLGKLNDVSRSKFGIGGLMSPYGGVKPGIKLIMKAMKEGARYYFQSDIKAFFSAIPTELVVGAVRAETNDQELAELFDHALAVNLANKEDLAGYSHIFPSNGIGVAQGSSLSAFAGNVLLYELDHILNDMSVTAVRYIDDFFIVSSSKSKLEDAVEYAKSQLTGFGFSLYSPVPGSMKASAGDCSSAFTYLGCTIQPGRCVPSVNSKNKLLLEIREQISKSKKKIKDLVESNGEFDPTSSFCSTIDSIGKKLFGWQKSFSFCTDGQVFRIIDAKVAEYIYDYDQTIRRFIKDAPIQIRMQALGIPSTTRLFHESTSNSKERE